MPDYAVNYDPATGSVIGATRAADGAFVPKSALNADWQAFTAWAASQVPPVDYTTPAAPTARKPRTLYAIRADLAALTSTQKSNVWAALTAGTPPLWATDAGPNAAALATMQALAGGTSLAAADVLECKTRAAAMYLQDNPAWLVHPAFDATINVAGDQPA